MLAADNNTSRVLFNSNLATWHHAPSDFQPRTRSSGSDDPELNAVELGEIFGRD